MERTGPGLCLCNHAYTDRFTVPEWLADHLAFTVISRFNVGEWEESASRNKATLAAWHASIEQQADGIKPDRLARFSSSEAGAEFRHEILNALAEGWGVADHSHV